MPAERLGEGAANGGSKGLRKMAGGAVGRTETSELMRHVARKGMS